MILREPFAGLPDWVADGCSLALDSCLNQAHRATKRTEFQSMSSEDHVTWTILRFLQREQALGRAFGHPDLLPDVLVWGAPVPNDSVAAQALRKNVIKVLDRIGEAERWRTEPDIILDFGDSGLVIVEAKLFSDNDSKASDYGGWTTYLDATSVRDPACARSTGRYELVRNWRLGVDLAGDRPFTLVNLAPALSAAERRILAQLRIAFGTSSSRRFKLRTWASLVSAGTVPEWLKRYAARRRLNLQAAPEAQLPVG
jgi:hypothetical protein